jgi:hypothetical protein
VGPTVLGWRRDPLYRGDGEGFLVFGEKEGRGQGRRGFLASDPLYHCFFIRDGKEKLLKLL